VIVVLEMLMIAYYVCRVHSGGLFVTVQCFPWVKWWVRQHRQTWNGPSV